MSVEKNIPVKEAVETAVRPEVIGVDWSYLLDPALVMTSGGYPSREQRTRQTGIDQEIAANFGLEINDTATKVVNNRLARYGRALYRTPRGKNGEGTPTEIKKWLSATNYGTYLAQRFAELLLIAVAGFLPFYGIPLLFDMRAGALSGVLALAVSMGVLALVLGTVYFHNVAVPSSMRFLQRRNYSILKQTQDALGDLKDTIEGFGVETDRACLDYIGQSDLNDDPYYEKQSFAFAKALMLQDVLRRSAQYLEFQTGNLNDQFDGFGMTRERMKWQQLRWWVVVWGFVAVVGLGSLNAVAMGSKTMTGVFVWDVAGIPLLPAIHFLVMAGVILSLGKLYQDWYCETRWRLNSAIDWFYRRGDALSVEQIANFPMDETGNACTDWELSDAELSFLKRKTDPKINDDARDREEFERAFAQLEKEARERGEPGRLFHSIHPATRKIRNGGRFFWADFALRRDPTARLMQRYVKLLQQVRDMPGGVQRAFGDDDLATPASGDHRSAADARPRPRPATTMSTLSRREVWRP